jgi:hypothetical protein
MYIFLIAILISLVIRWVARQVVNFYIDMDLPSDELEKSFVFNVAVILYVINSGLIWINSAVLAALIIKPYL